MMMQGYDMDAAVPFIAKAMRKAGHREPQEALEGFIRRAIEADMAYMRETDVIDADGLMGEGEYDEDDAFEALLDVLGEGVTDEDELNRIAQRLDSYMNAQADFLDESGLAD